MKLRSASLKIVLCLVSVLSVNLIPAQAQDERAIERKIDRLEKQLNAVQRKVFEGGDQRYFGSENDAGDGGAVQIVPGGGGLIADLQVRVEALESRLRSLTGRLEEADFKNQQLIEQMQRLREDMDFRLTRLEQGNGAAPSPGDGPANTKALTSQDAPQKGPGDRNGNTGAVFIPSTSPNSSGVSKEEPKEVFNAAFKFMSQGDYQAAESGFKTFLERYPANPLASNAQYWLGRTYLVQKDYPKAAAAFFAGHSDYPDGAKAPQNLLGLSTALFELGQKEEACSALDLLRVSYSDAGSDIIQRMAAERGRFGCK